MNLMLAWMVAMGIQTWHSVTPPDPTMPLPSMFMASGIVFTGLAMIGAQGPNAEKVAGVAAWAFVIGVYLAAKDQSRAPKASAALFGGKGQKGTGKAKGTTKQPTPTLA